MIFDREYVINKNSYVDSCIDSSGHGDGVRFGNGDRFGNGEGDGYGYGNGVGDGYGHGVGKFVNTFIVISDRDKLRILLRSK